MWARIFTCAICAAVLAISGCEEEKVEETGIPIAQIQFADPMLQQCIAGHGKADSIELTAVDCTMQYIGALQGLDKLTGMNELLLSKNLISDLSPLSSLLDMSKLYLSDNQISDLTGLSEMIKLTDLSLARNQISNLGPLSRCTMLFWLDLDENLVTDLTPLSKILTLLSLNLGQNQLTDITPLSNKYDLMYLELWRNQISDLIPLTKLTNLYWLSLSENKITDLAPLASLTSLTQLALDWQYKNPGPGETPMPIADVSPLAGLTKLRQLYLDGNAITDVSPLGALPALQTLSLSDNQITDMSQFEAFKAAPSLRVIVLDNNGITEGIEHFAVLTQLEKLYLYGNEGIPCSDLDALEMLVKEGVLVRPEKCHKPIAVAGDSQAVAVGATVQLDGSGSGTETTEDGTVIGQEKIQSYAWTIVDFPGVIPPVLSNPAIANPTFVADQAGKYVVHLVVNDGTGDSEPDLVGVLAASPE